MNAVLKPPQYIGLSDTERARRIRAEVQLVTRFRRADLRCVSWRCPICRGRVEIHGRFDERGHLVGSSGRCRTDDCVHWEE